MTLPIVESNFSGEKGLTIQPVAPTAFPLAFISSVDSVVKQMIGMIL